MKLPMDETTYGCTEFVKLIPWNKESVSLLKWGVMSVMGERLSLKPGLTSLQDWNSHGINWNWLCSCKHKVWQCFLGWKSAEGPWISVRIHITTLLKDYATISNAQIYTYIYVYGWVFINMPFFFLHRPVFKDNQGNVDRDSRFSPLFRQESNKISMEDLIKLIAEYRR